MGEQWQVQLRRLAEAQRVDGFLGRKEGPVSLRMYK